MWACRWWRGENIFLVAKKWRWWAERAKHFLVGTKPIACFLPNEQWAWSAIDLVHFSQVWSRVHNHLHFMTYVTLHFQKTTWFPRLPKNDEHWKPIYWNPWVRIHIALPLIHNLTENFQEKQVVGSDETVRDGNSPALCCVLLCFGAVFHSLTLPTSLHFLWSRLPKKGPEEKNQG